MPDVDMAQVYSLISMVGFIAAAGCAVVAVIFWFRFKIPEVIRYLTGKSARVSIEKKRTENASKNQSGYHFRMHVGEGKSSEQIQIRKAAQETDSGQVLGNGEESTLPLEGVPAVSQQEMVHEFETISLEQSTTEIEHETVGMKGTDAVEQETAALKPEIPKEETETAPLRQEEDMGGTVSLKRDLSDFGDEELLPEEEADAISQMPRDGMETAPLRQTRGKSDAGYETAPRKRQVKPTGQANLYDTVSLERETESLRSETASLESGTQVLKNDAVSMQDLGSDKKTRITFRMVQDIVLVHTDERID